MIKQSKYQKKKLKALLNLESKKRKLKASQNKLTYKKGNRHPRLADLNSIQENHDFQIDLEKMKKIFRKKNRGKKNGNTTIL